VILYTNLKSNKSNKRRDFKMKRRTTVSWGQTSSSVNALGILLIVAFAFCAVTAYTAQMSASVMTLLPHFRTFDGKSYQFRGTDTNGQPIPDGPHTLVFSIWDDSTGGLSLWSETQMVNTEDGLGHVVVGGLAAVPVDILTPGRSDTAAVRYLQVSIDGETIQPRIRLLASPYANLSERVMGDIITSSGKVEIPATEELFGAYNFLLENSSDSGAGLTIETAGSPSRIDPYQNYKFKISIDGVSQEIASYDGTAGMSVESTVGVDSVGDPEARLTYYGLDGTAAKKPREIVVVGSKVKDVVRFYENATEDEVAVHDHVSGRTTGERRYPPLKVTGAVLPDTIPAYALSVDSNGSEMTMSKNKSDGSSCWVRVATTTTGAMWDLNDDDVTKSTSSSQKSSPGLLQSNCKGTHVGGDTTEVNEFVSVDSGYQREVMVTNGTSNTTTVDAADYALWHRHYRSTSSSGDSGTIKQHVTPKGFGFVAISDPATVERGLFGIVVGDSLGEDPNDYTTTNVQEIDPTAGVSSFTLRSTTDSSNSATALLEARKSGNESAAISSLRTLVSSNTMFHETKLDSGGISDISSLDDGTTSVVIITGLTALGTQLNTKFQRTSSTADANASTTVDSTGTNWSLHSTATAGGTSDAEINTSPAETRLAIMNIGSSGEDGVAMNAGGGGSGMTFHEILPTRAQVDRIYMNQDASGVEFYISNNGTASDGVRMTSNSSNGGRVGINTSSPSVALHVVGDICYTGGITNCSDGRYKENVATIDNALDKVEQLRGVEYKWKKNQYPEMRFSDRQQLGLVAQEVKEVLPELVTEDKNGYYSIDYVKLTPILIEAIKEQQKSIEELKLMLGDKDQLSERLNKLERLMGSVIEKD
jgi:hypothetical protein